MTEVTYEKKTDSELQEIAADIVAGKIFTDRHIDPEEANDLVPKVFKPLDMMNNDQLLSLKELGIGFLYEYNERATGEVKGTDHPTFTSFSMLDLMDTERMLGYYDDYDVETQNYKDN